MYQFLILLQSAIILSTCNGFLIYNKPDPFSFDNGNEKYRVEVSDWKKVDIPCLIYPQISNDEKIEFLQKRSNTDTPMRRSSLDKNFMRFGRSEFSQDEKCCKQKNSVGFSKSALTLDDSDSIISSRRNSDNNFMRFGRDLKEGFMRFGRDLKEGFMRFGRTTKKGRTGEIDYRSMHPRDEAESVKNGFSRNVKNDHFMRFGKSTKDQSDFVRLGKSNGKNDNFIRFGKKGGKNGTNFLRYRSDHRDAIKREDDRYYGKKNSDVGEDEWRSDSESRTKRKNRQTSRSLGHYLDADLPEHTVNDEVIEEDAGTSRNKLVEDLLKGFLEDKFTVLSYIKPCSPAKGDFPSNIHKWELGSLKSLSPYLPLLSRYLDNSSDFDYSGMESLSKRKQNGSSFIRFG